MNIFVVNVVIVLAVVTGALGAESPYKQCPGKNFEELAERIKVIPCSKSLCKLIKGTNTTVEFRFKPKHDVQELKNEVSAEIGPLKLPFIGVTGASACHEVYHADTMKHAPCPLQKGLEYVYRNVFPIYDIYPNARMTVHWSLLDGDKDVICFEVPASIGNAKVKSGKKL